MPQAPAGVEPHRKTPRWGSVRRLFGLLSMGAAGALVSGCTQGGLQPNGEEADRLFTLTWTLTLAGTVVAVVVLVLLLWGAWRKPKTATEHNRAEHVDDTRFEKRLVVVGGIVLPAVILLGFFGFNLVEIRAQPQSGDVTIEVTGHRYWWEVVYRGVPGLDGTFETANQIHVPTDTDVTAVLRSDDVIHSFWVPQIAGKVDHIPGRANQFTFKVEEPGVYPGYCAEYCGLQHAWMKFDVVAMEPDEFTTWAQQTAADAPEPQTELQARGREVFAENACVGCHAIRGVDDQGELGPDLTHLASRSELGAGIIDLTEDNLAAWVVNAQTIKPGVNMPPQELSEEDLRALVAYLMSLE